MKGFLDKLFFVTFLSAVFCFAWSAQDKGNVRIPTPLVLMFRQQAEICEKETGVPASFMTKILDKSLPNELSSLKFFHCISFNTGYTDKDGHFVPEKMSNFEVLDGSMEDYVNAIKECNKSVKEDYLQTLDATSDCVHKAYTFTPVAPK